jgi:hypothetical protein
MVAVKIEGFDENKSGRDAQSSTIVFKLSAAPDNGWVSTFNSCWTKNRLQGVVSVVVRGKELTVAANNSLPAQQILDAMKKCVEAANGSEDDFQKQLRDLKF